MLSYISAASYETQTCWFSLCLPSVCVHVKDAQNHHPDCKMTLAPRNLLFIAGQIVYNGLMTVWAPGNHLTWEGTHAHCNTDTQVNGNSCWHCHGKCLSQCPGSVPYGWIWLGRGEKKKKKVCDQRISGWTETQIQCQKTCCNLVDQMFALCVSARYRINFPHFLNNSTESNWSGQRNRAKNTHFSVEH